MNCDPNQEKMIDRASSKIIENYPDPNSGDPITVTFQYFNN